MSLFNDWKKQDATLFPVHVWNIIIVYVNVVIGNAKKKKKKV